jgi:RimJ/RimL family protein N-acetyltransferase
LETSAGAKPRQRSQRSQGSAIIGTSQIRRIEGESAPIPLLSFPGFVRSRMDRSRLMFPDYFCDDVFRLESQRLWLRWPTAADAGAIERLAGEREVAEHTAHIPHPYPVGGAHDFILSTRRANAAGEALGLAIALKHKPTSLIGMIGLEGAGETVELGYWLGRPYWGAGLISEAVATLLDMVWLATDIEEIEASASLLNPRSRRVLERAGFVCAGETLHPAPARDAPLPAGRFELHRARPRFGWEAQDRPALPRAAACL